MSRRARTRAVSHLGRTAYAERLRAAVRAALDRPGGPGSPIAFSAAARELVFRTIALNAMHPEIGDAGDEFRLLMPLDGGSHYRFLAGPAATSERAPRISPDDRLYPVASWEARGDGIEITDPAWPAHLALGDRAIALLECCDGTRTLGIVMNAMGAPPAELEAVLGTAQSLVDGGVLCPLEQHS